MRSKSEKYQKWVDAGVQSCIKNGYGLDLLTVNWEAREQRYAGYIDDEKLLIVEDVQPIEWPIMDNLQDIAAYIKDLPSRLRDFAEVDSGRVGPINSSCKGGGGLYSF